MTRDEAIDALFPDCVGLAHDDATCPCFLCLLASCPCCWDDVEVAIARRIAAAEPDAAGKAAAT